MRFLLDTNACIMYLNQKESKIAEYMRRYQPDNISLCSVVKAELFYGAMKSRWPERTLAKQQVFLSQFQSLPFDDRAADYFGRIRAELARLGTPIGPYDLQIAAVALANDLTLVSHNTLEFKRIPTLKLVDWEI